MNLLDFLLGYICCAIYTPSFYVALNFWGFLYCLIEGYGRVLIGLKSMNPYRTDVTPFIPNLRSVRNKKKEIHIGVYILCFLLLSYNYRALSTIFIKRKEEQNVRARERGRGLSTPPPPPKEKKRAIYLFL